MPGKLPAGFGPPGAAPAHGPKRQERPVPVSKPHAPQAEEQRLLERWLERRDRAARDELVRRLLPIARRLARRYNGLGDSFDDLVQVAAVGILKAVDRYDSGRGAPLWVYAERMADGELRHHLRDTGTLLHLPRALHARLMAVIRTAARLPPHPGGGPRTDEIAAILELSRAEVTDALQAGSALDVRSLDQPAPGRDDRPPAYADRLGAEDKGFELVEDRSVIDRAWRSLDPRARESLVLRLVHDLTYREIAERLGMSVTHVVRLVTRSLERLQTVARASEGN